MKKSSPSKSFQFEFPGQELLVEFISIQSPEYLQRLLDIYQGKYRQDHIYLKYEITVVKEDEMKETQTIYAFCQYCQDCLVYKKRQGENVYTLETIDHQHKNHPIIASDNEESSYQSVKNIAKVEKTQQKRKLSAQDEQESSFQKQFIVQWLRKYEKQSIKLITNNEYVYEDSLKRIDASILRNSIYVKHPMIDNEQEEDIFENFWVWAEIIDQLMKTKQFIKTQIRESENSDIDCPLINSLFMKKTFIKSETCKKTIFLIRRQVQLDTYINAASSQGNIFAECLIAFELNSLFLPDILWLTVLEQCQNTKSQLETSLIQQVLLQVESLRTFEECTIVLERDQVLLRALESLRTESQHKSPDLNLKLCINPAEIISMILRESNISADLSMQIKEIIRLCNKQSATQKFQKVFKACYSNSCIRKIFKHKKFIWLSQMNSAQEIGFSYLEEDFWKRNYLCHPFKKIQQALNFSGSISCYQLFVVILTMFDNFKDLFKDSIKILDSDQYNVKFQIEHYFQMASPKPSEQMVNNIFKIFSDERYEFEKMTQQCSRIIIQLIYQFIPNAFDILVQKISFEEIIHKGMTKLRDKNTLCNYNVVFKTQMYRQNSAHQKHKLWYCDCKFYQKYGIPCIHEVLCAIQFQTSVFAQISPKWKLSSLKENRIYAKQANNINQKKKQCKLVTDCLRRLK